jgi:hypothetical protein
MKQQIKIKEKIIESYDKTKYDCIKTKGLILIVKKKSKSKSKKEVQNG